MPLAPQRRTAGAAVTGLSALLLTTTGLSAPATAQDTVSLSETAPVVVESTRIPTALDKTGASVTVITEEDIERAQDREVTDTLRRVPGLNITQNGAFGGQASVFLRGANSEQTLVLIDGVEVNDPSSPGNGFDFGGLSASDIERIEILRGPQSTLHGSDAIGGVISITTKSGEKGFEANAFAEAGSFDTLRGSGTIRGGGTGVRGGLTVSGTRSDGISAAEANNGNDEEDGFRDLSVSGRGSLDVTDNLTFDGALSIVDQEQEFDGFTFGVGATDADNVSESQRVSGRLTGTHTAFDGRLENQVSVKVFSTKREDENGAGALTLDADGQRNTLEYQGTVDATEWLVVSFGAEREESEFDTASPQFGTQQTGNTNMTSGYGLVQVSPVERLTLTGGLRHDASESYENKTTARASAALDIHETGTTLRGLWGEGFKAPTPFQLTFICTTCGAFSAPGATPAPASNLQPEESTSWEVGVDQTVIPGRLDASLTYFNQEIDNLIDFDFNGVGFQNINETEQQGLEASLNATLTQWASLSANYTLLDAEDKQTGDDLDRRPRHKGSADIRLTPTATSTLGGTLTYQGKSEDGTTTLDDFVLVSLRGSLDVSDRATVFARLENLLDQDYQTAEGFGQPGVSGFAGVRVTF